MPLVEQETVPTDSGYVSVDSLWCDLEISGNLTICHASNGLHDDVGVEVWAFLPVVLGECLGAKASFAGFACKPLDTEWWL